VSGLVGHPAHNGLVTFQPMLSLWDEPAPDHTARIVARSSDRLAWLRARRRGVTATDVARLSGPKSLRSVALEKLSGSGFGGNAYTDHGLVREPEIARWVMAQHRIAPNSALFHAIDEPLHMATPDGVAMVDGKLTLAEIKTTTNNWRSIPRSYLRQVWWQQYVLGADRTLVVWEHHTDFVPTRHEPECRWVDRDENEIYMLISLANQLLQLLGR
jgi:hypothetical protein